MNNYNSRYRVSLSTLSVIQEFLHANFTLTKLALTSKRVREALFQRGLRQNRYLIIDIPTQDFSQISQKAVRQMVDFSQELVLKQGSMYFQKDYFIRNLDKLSDDILKSIEGTSLT
ncbi:hypothetical protein FGO68_gene17781 [Halteria grandinella]|uniref:Uncharacterized protein n=1 Tax=Halteria grandinella TaxID=5974 RepID=A0A8J8NQN9_HALGN|nr:hypothetical protein FGO68_gene17781 [Halteria grandinella]